MTQRSVQQFDASTIHCMLKVRNIKGLGDGLYGEGVEQPVQAEATGELRHG